MLDYQRLVAPAAQGGVLVVPAPRVCAELVRQNARQLDASQVRIAQTALGALRKHTRQRFGLEPDQRMIVIGHQPDFIHAGVWAKNVFAGRLAQFFGGAAVNLAVDCDAPKRLSIRVPADRGGRLAYHDVPMGHWRHGRIYEQARALGKSDIEGAKHELIALRKGRFDASMMPSFLTGVAASSPTDWVNQIVAGRRAIEAEFGVAVRDARISQAWWSPMAVHVLLDPAGFAGAYNRALDKYRMRNKVRAANRPIPNLAIEDERVELPFWLYRDDHPRNRAFVAIKPGEVILSAGTEPVFVLSKGQIASIDDLVALTEKESGWRLRPRALMTTIWSRLCLADLFVHGIGGAKYDRISDNIIEDFFGLPAPSIACVTATLYLDDSCEKSVDLREWEHELRDATWNPQRHMVESKSNSLHDLLDRRDRIARRSNDLAHAKGANPEKRHALFLEVRRLNEMIHATCPQLLADMGSKLERARSDRANHRVACDREFFFALHSRSNLEKLLNALPGSADFV